MSSNNVRGNPNGVIPYFPVQQENRSNYNMPLLPNVYKRMMIFPPAANMVTPDYVVPLQENRYQVNYPLTHNEEEVDDDEEYVKNIPLGYRFEPSDEELINDYLKKKIYNHKFPRNIIKEVDLYGYNPEELIGKYGRDGEKEWHFFTSRTKKYLGGKRASRRAGDGFWRPLNVAQEIISRDCNKNDQIVIGYRTSLRYFKGEFPNSAGTEWLMKEYTVKDAPRHVAESQHDMKLDDWVVCKVYKSPSCKRKNKEADAAANDSDRPRNIKRSKKNNHKVEAVSSANHADDHRPTISADSSHNINVDAAAATADQIQELDQAASSDYANNYDSHMTNNNDDDTDLMSELEKAFQAEDADDVNNIYENEANPEMIRGLDEEYQPMDDDDDDHRWLRSVLVF